MMWRPSLVLLELRSSENSANVYGLHPWVYTDNKHTSSCQAELSLKLKITWEMD